MADRLEDLAFTLNVIRTQLDEPDIHPVHFARFHLLVKCAMRNLSHDELDSLMNQADEMAEEAVALKKDGWKRLGDDE